MHLLIPFAAPLSEAGRQALRSLALPGLAALLARLAPAELDAADEWTLSPPHERALAQALGWQAADGCLPWAARWAAADGVDPRSGPGLAWGLLSPAHWHLGTDQVSLLDPASLLLDAATSKALFDAVSELFTSRGWQLAWGHALRWYAAHDSLAALPCASLDRVVGRNVDRWLGHDAAARRLRLLQSEAQMLLHAHPLNEAREAQGLLPVNSFWLSGCGVEQVATGPEPRVDERLRAPALADDWPGWARAWQTLDEGPLAELSAALAHGQPVRLTLCGERSAASFAAARTGSFNGWLQRARAFASRPAVLPLLESL
jgi:hypothetical protein